MNWNRLLAPEILALLIPILAILGWIISSLLQHRERMAMIANGMDPDAAKKARKEAGASQQSQR
jgi:hypothetical protein